MQTDIEQNLLTCEGFEEGEYALTRAEAGRIIAQKRDRLYTAARTASVCFAVISAALMAGFKLNEGFLDANSRIGILMESVNVQEDKLLSPKINVRTNFRDEKKSRLVIPLSIPIEEENVSITEEFTQDKYVLTLSGYSENFPDGLELVSDSAIMEAVGVYRQNDDVVVEIYCRDLYDCELATGDSALAVNFRETEDRYAAKAVIWFPYDDKNRMALPEWRQNLEKFASDNRIRLYIAPDMQEEYTQSDVIAFANEIHADMVLGVEVEKTDAQHSYLTGICNTIYFIPGYNSTHLAVVMAEIFSQTTQIGIRSFEEGRNHALVSEATVPAAVIKLSLTQKDRESVENEYKLNQKIAASLEGTMGGVLENYLKMGET
ncbi:MAG: hypothetical protein K2N73_08275 [Lachnospiraceae bacterium]|nr:hypothetical protein [Lachnospiraceae bacterium]